MTDPKSKKIQNLLKEFSSLYDNNQYSHGLRLAKKSVKQFPDNAELLAWMALFQQFTKDTKGSLETISNAIRKDMKNGNIWKIQGIIHREQCNYVKSLQSFTMANKLIPNVDVVLNEICNLHLYERNKKLFLSSARQYLNMTAYSNSCVRYALALHLDGNIELAIDWLDKYEQNFKPPNNNDEINFRTELFLYHATLYQESGKYEECIHYLEKMNLFMRDSVSILEKYAFCNMKLGKTKEALENLHKLIDYYPENGDYFKLLEELLIPKDSNDYGKYFEELKKIMKKSRYAQVRLLELMDINDPEFKNLLKEYLVPYLIKGAPSLFTTVSELSKEKLNMAREIAEEATKLEGFPISSIPIVRLFDANVLMSFHEYDKALECVDAAIKHTPTCLEAISLKVRILRNLGRIDESAEVGKELAQGDPNDRHSNTTYVNACLRDGKLKTAFEEAEPFSIDQSKNPKLLLYQYNDFHVRVADCTYRAKEYTISARFYTDVLKHFEDFKRSQYNYLLWGMRHINSLYEVITWADELPKHPLLARALLGLLKIHFLSKGSFKIENNSIVPNDLASVAIQATHSETPAALAYAAIYFANNKEPLPTLKCFLKCSGPWKYAARPAVEKLLSNLPESTPSLIKEVVNELYTPFEGQPTTFLERLSDARGRFLIGDSSSKDLLLSAVKECEYRYKEALDAYTVANNEMSDEEFAKQVQDAIHSKYPSYQLVFEYEKCEIPVEIDDD